MVLKNNKLGQRFFMFGLGMFAVFSIIVYSVIYNGIPILYHYYKKATFEGKIEYILTNSKTVKDLDINIRKFKNESNAYVVYEYNGRSINCLTDRCEDAPSSNNRKFFVARPDILVKHEKLEVEGKDGKGKEMLVVNFALPLSSAKEVRSILFLFLPVFAFLSVSMALILAYFISIKMSRSIVSLRNDAKRITSLNFDIVQSVSTDDELGDLSESLVELASTLAKTLADLKIANNKLNDDIERERIKEEERRAYIATLSHDLKTPLTAIKGQLEGMLFNIGKYKDHDTYLKKNIDLTGEMERIIQSIIISSKLDDYNTTINKQKILLNTCILESLEELEYVINEKELTINNLLKDDEFVIVDYSLFSKILANLISNAVEYAESKTEIVIELKNDMLMFSNSFKNFDMKLIEDNLIYQPFYRQDKSRNRQGSGLGMYIVKRICDLHDIDIFLSYENEKFTVSLKLQNVKVYGVE